MRKSSRPGDGDQDLTIAVREAEGVVREITGDNRFKGHQHYKFQAEFDDADGERLWGGEASAGVAFQIGQSRYFIFQGYTCQILWILF